MGPSTTRAALTRRSCLGSVIAAPFVATGVSAQDITAAFPEEDVTLLRPQDAAFEKHQAAYNLRTALRPRVRALARTVTGLQRLVEFARAKDIPFAVRGGGHSFEGLSQSEGFVIDTRLMNGVRADAGTRMIDVKAGASLGEIYRAAARLGMCFPAGSCPTVGVAGHILGGGFGLLARPFGIASDSLQSVDLVDANGSLRHVTPYGEPDLFWALSGGGGGSFGLAASLRLQLYPVGRVLTFNQSFILPVADAAAVVQAWQAWAPIAPHEITSVLKLSSPVPGRVGLRLAGQSTGEPMQLETELKRFASDAGQIPSAKISAGSFFQAVDKFSGGWGYESKYSKAKSDFVFSPLSRSAIETLLRSVTSLPPNNVIVILDSYGGAIGRKRNDDTAFAFRDALYCIQYYSSWQDTKQTQSRLSQINRLYAAMRAYMPGFAYVNYCDLDLQDFHTAYWGANAKRLRSVKASTDPKNLFRHAQSVMPA